MFVNRNEILYGIGKKHSDGKEKWKDNKRKLIKREIQWEFLKDCRMRRIIPRSMEMKERKDCRTEKYERLRKAMENEILDKVSK